MEAERRLVLDANTLIRAVLGPRARNIIFENAERTTCFAPEIAYDDARKYLPALAAKRGAKPEAAMQTLEVLDALEGVVLAVAQETYEVARLDAEARLEGRDLSIEVACRAALNASQTNPWRAVPRTASCAEARGSCQGIRAKSAWASRMRMTGS